MKIIEHGTPPEPRKFKGTCPKCGCHFECDEKSDSITYNLFGSIWLNTGCPEPWCSHRDPIRLYSIFRVQSIYDEDIFRRYLIPEKHDKTYENFIYPYPKLPKLASWLSY